MINTLPHFVIVNQIGGCNPGRRTAVWIVPKNSENSRIKFKYTNNVPIIHIVITSHYETVSKALYTIPTNLDVCQRRYQSSSSSEG